MSLLTIERIDKMFGSHAALSGVSLDIAAGEVHALVGENGAGKSTLIKVVTGVYAPDGGSLRWEGRPVAVPNPKSARDIGINVVHQDRHLVPSFTGMENLYLGLEYPAGRFGLRVRWSDMRRRAESLMKELGLALPLGKRAADMSPPEKTMLEIMRAMMLDCRLLILDEPTASLTDHEAELLFGLIRRLTAKGTAIVYVSHRMNEIFRLADRITVLRNGQVAGTLAAADTDQERLVQLMAGAEVERLGRTRHARGAAGQAGRASDPVQVSGLEHTPVLLRAERIATADGRVRDVSLHVRRGEIAGLFGLAGSGRTELLEAIYGVRAMKRGRIELAGEAVRKPSARTSLDRGMVLIPEDRRGHALIMSLSIRENMTLPVLHRFASAWRLAVRREKTAAAERMAAMNVKAQHAEQSVQELSGGNQQKVVFAKALLSEPSVFLCDEPTQAVDVRTREDIHRLLRVQAEEGRGVLYVSSDLQEVLDVADRIYVIHDGEIVGETANEGVTPEHILQLIYARGKERERNDG